MALPEIERLAKVAAKEVEAKIIDMLQSGGEGEIIVALGFNDLAIYDRPKKLMLRRKIERGHWAVIKSVK